ncbi:hypothetical protein ACP4OV_010971 [Aristida adscensionis]
MGGPGSGRRKQDGDGIDESSRRTKLRRLGALHIADDGGGAGQQVAEDADGQGRQEPEVIDGVGVVVLPAAAAGGPGVNAGAAPNPVLADHGGDAGQQEAEKPVPEIIDLTGDGESVVVQPAAAAGAPGINASAAPNPVLADGQGGAGQPQPQPGAEGGGGQGQHGAPALETLDLISRVGQYAAAPNPMLAAHPQHPVAGQNLPFNAGAAPDPMVVTQVRQMMQPFVRRQVQQAVADMRASGSWPMSTDHPQAMRLPGAHAWGTGGWRRKQPQPQAVAVAVAARCPECHGIGNPLCTTCILAGKRRAVATVPPPPPPRAPLANQMGAPASSASALGWPPTGGLQPQASASSALHQRPIGGLHQSQAPASSALHQRPIGGLHQSQAPASSALHQRPIGGLHQFRASTSSALHRAAAAVATQVQQGALAGRPAAESSDASGPGAILQIGTCPVCIYGAARSNATPMRHACVCWPCIIDGAECPVCGASVRPPDAPR